LAEQTVVRSIDETLTLGPIPRGAVEFPPSSFEKWEKGDFDWEGIAYEHSTEIACPMAGSEEMKD
jgi:hypothetical protein